MSEAVQTFVRDLDRVRVHQSKDRGPSLKKPLLLLLVLSKIGNRELRSNRVHFSDVEDELRELIQSYGNTSGSTNPEEPFFYLHTAPFWRIHLDPRAGTIRKKASATALRKPESYAELDEKPFQAVSGSSRERKAAVAAVLDRWLPDGTPEDLLRRLGV